MIVFLLNNRGRSTQPPPTTATTLFLLHHFIKIHLEPRRLGVRALTPGSCCVFYIPVSTLGLAPKIELWQVCLLLSRGFNPWCHPGTPLPSPQRWWPALGYRGNLPTRVPALPSFSTAPPGTTGCGVSSSVPRPHGLLWSLLARLLGLGGMGLTRGGQLLLPPWASFVDGSGQSRAADKMPQTKGA